MKQDNLKCRTIRDTFEYPKNRRTEKETQGQDTKLKTTFYPSREYTSERISLLRLPFSPEQKLSLVDSETTEQFFAILRETPQKSPAETSFLTEVLQSSLIEPSTQDQRDGSEFTFNPSNNHFDDFSISKMGGNANGSCDENRNTLVSFARPVKFNSKQSRRSSCTKKTVLGPAADELQ